MNGMESITPESIVDHVIRELKKPITAIMDETLTEYPSEPYVFINSLQGHNWYDAQIIKEMEFEFEWSRFTFKQFLNVMEMIGGMRFADQVDAMLREQLIELAESRIDQFMYEGQAQFHYEHEREIERHAV